MLSEGGVSHLRPFFPAAEDFVAETAPHFQFLVDAFGFSGPVVTEQAEQAYDVRYDGGRTSVLLNWEVDGGFFACQLIPRLAGGELDTNYDHWLSPSEIMGARGLGAQRVTPDALDGVDEAGYAQVMEREARNLRTHCADVLRGDWSVYDAAHGWLERQARGR